MLKCRGSWRYTEHHVALLTSRGRRRKKVPSYSNLLSQRVSEICKQARKGSSSLNCLNSAVSSDSPVCKLGCQQNGMHPQFLQVTVSSAHILKEPQATLNNAFSCFTDCKLLLQYLRSSIIPPSCPAPLFDL